MQRRQFLATGSTLAIGATLAGTPALSAAQERRFEPRPAGWRTFEVTTRVELREAGPAKVWIPLPGSGNQQLGFVMYPQALNAKGLFDCLKPETFVYTIQAREIGSVA